MLSFLLVEPRTAILHTGIIWILFILSVAISETHRTRILSPNLASVVEVLPDGAVPAGVQIRHYHVAAMTAGVRDLICMQIRERVSISSDKEGFYL